MKSLALTYAILFLISSTMSASIGSRVLMVKKRNKLTWPFFAIAICLSVWSFGFAMSISAPTEVTCLFWRRFSALGWTTIFAFLLEFVLRFTGGTKLMNYKWASVVHYTHCIGEANDKIVSNKIRMLSAFFINGTS